MKKYTLITCTFILSLSTSLMAQVGSSNGMAEKQLREQKTKKVQQKYTGATVLESNTFSAPSIMSSPIASFGALPSGKEAMKIASTLGYQGDLLFRGLPDQGARVQFKDLQEEASLFWLFENPKDLRNRWVRMRYTGLKTPSVMHLSFDQDEKRLDSTYKLYLDPSAVSDSVFFKLPDKYPFSDIESIRMTIDPNDLASRDADFMILGLDLLDTSADPLAGFEPTDVNRFGWYANPLDPENKVTLNSELVF